MKAPLEPRRLCQREIAAGCQCPMYAVDSITIYEDDKQEYSELPRPEWRVYTCGQHVR